MGTQLLLNKTSSYLWGRTLWNPVSADDRHRLTPVRLACVVLGVLQGSASGPSISWQQLCDLGYIYGLGLEWPQNAANGS